MKELHIYGSPEKPEPSKAFEKEAQARVEGKHYADLQKAETIEKYGRVEK